MDFIHPAAYPHQRVSKDEIKTCPRCNGTQFSRHEYQRYAPDEEGCQITIVKLSVNMVLPLAHIKDILIRDVTTTCLYPIFRSVEVLMSDILLHQSWYHR